MLRRDRLIRMQIHELLDACLFAVAFWLAAFFLRKKSRWWTLAATGLMIAVYLIPHSILGSELNYETGKVGTAQKNSDSVSGSDRVSSEHSANSIRFRQLSS
jgi:hypothetical protein